MRNYACRNYAECLAAAAHDNTAFHCDACPRYRPEPYHATVADIAGSLALLVALMRPDEYRSLSGLPGFKVMLMRAMVAVLRGDRDFS